MADLDRLQIQIEASAAEAMPALDDVINKLTDLNNALRGVGNAGKSFQKSMTGLSNTSITLGRSVGSGFGKALTKGIEGSIQNAFKGVGSIIKNISKMAVIGIPSLGIKGFQLVGSGFKLVGKGALAAASGIKNFASFVQGAKEESKNLTSILGGLYLRLWGLKKVGSIIGTIASKAMNFVESYHYFEMAFQKIGEDAADNWAEAGYESAEAYADSFRTRALELTEKMSGFAIDAQGNATATGNKSLGLDPEMLVNYQAMYGQMANGLGLVSESASNASKALTMLGADWSSLRNIDFSTSYEKLASALAGQSRAVRSLGIDITQATLQQYAYAAGVNTSVSEMDQAAKTQLRLIAILDQSRVAWGDMAKTLNTPANQFRLLQQNVASLARTIGSILLPILKIVLPYINAVVIALQRLFAWLAKLLNADTEEVTTAIGGMNDAFADMGDDMDGIDTSGIDAVADSANDATDAIGDTVDELEEAKRTILGFDELNVLNAPVKDTASATPTGGGLTPTSGSGVGGFNPGDMGLLDDYLGSLLGEYETKWNEAFNSMANKAQQIADAIVDAFKKKDWYGLGQLMASGVEWALKKIYDFLDPNTIYPKIKKVTDAITTVINSFIQNFPATLFGQTLGRMLNTYVFTMNQLYDGIDWPGLGTQLAVAFKGLLSEVDPYELGRLMTQKFRAAVAIFRGFLVEMMGEWENVGIFVGNMIAGAMSNINPHEIAFVISQGINAAIHFLAGLLTTDPLGEVATKLTTLLNDMIDGGIEWDNLGAVLGSWIEYILGKIDYVITNTKWGRLGTNIAIGLLNMLDKVKPETIGTTLEHTMTAILDFLGSAVNKFLTDGGFERVGEDIAAALNGVLGNMENWGKLGDLMHDCLIGALQILQKIRENFHWQDVANAIHDSIKKVIDDDELWDKAFSELAAWLKDICAFIRRALPTQEEWKTIGRRIAYFLEKIDWADLFFTVIKAIKDAVVGLWQGLGTTFAGKIMQGIILYKVGSHILSPITSQIGRYITQKFAEKLVNKVASGLGISLTNGANQAAGEVATNAGLGNFIGKIGEKLKTGISGLIEALPSAGEVASGLAPAAGFAGFIGLTLTATRELQKASEKARGLNGEITSVGTTVSNVADIAMNQSGPLLNLTNEQQKAVLKLQDDLENTGASNEEMATAMAGLLASFGYTAGEIEGMASNAANGINASAEMTKFWGSVVEQMPATVQKANSQIDLSNINSQNVVDELTRTWENNKNTMVESLGLTGTHFQNFESVMASVAGQSLNASEAYNIMKQRCEELNVPVEYLNGLFGIAYPGALTTATTATEEAKTNITQSTSEIKKKAGEDAEKLMEKWRDNSKKAKDSSVKNFNDGKTEISNAADDTVKAIEDKSPNFENAGKKVGESAGKGTATGITDKKTDVSTSADGVVDSAKESAAKAATVFRLVGDSAMEAMKLGFYDKQESVKNNLNARLAIIKNNLDTSIFESVGSDIVGKIAEGISKSSLFSAGQDLMASFQRGINSLHISIPHVGWNWERLDYGPADNRQWFEVPSLFVNWYARGGLATAPTIAGLGEAGNEAILPLTNKKAMSNIADAIVSGGGLGMSHDDMVEAVATGVAMAMAQNPQTVELVVNSVLKTDDEKLAQSVSRGRAKLDQRFNVASAY